ncbi:hypothetical protein [Nesterenkonia sp.]|uniref:hypothetical protein n=1 Tax=Nesterenkonia sp. TaxID=704201 RepID=UPI00262F6B46|nr:hypothetical protein [Nesterenkonia sp.]
MTKNLAQATIARRVCLAIREAGSDAHSVAEAADITDLEMVDRLNGRADFTLEELVRVGGFLRIPAPDLIKEAA